MPENAEKLSLTEVQTFLGTQSVDQKKRLSSIPVASRRRAASGGCLMAVCSRSSDQPSFAKKLSNKPLFRPDDGGLSSTSEAWRRSSESHFIASPQK